MSRLNYSRLVALIYFTKTGVSAGEMSVTYLGNQEYRHYVEVGPAVTAVNAAEAFCKSGYVVMSPGAWSIASQDRYNTEMMEDAKHVRVSKSI